MDYPLHRFEAMGSLTAADRSDLRQLATDTTRRSRGGVIHREGERLKGVHLLIDGWVASSLVLRSGKRLVQKIHLPGDIMGTPSMVLSEAADTLTVLTDARTAFVPERAMAEMFATKPRLTALFLMAVQLERLTLMDALASAGHGTAAENMAHFLLDLHARIGAYGGVRDDGFHLPVTQEMMGDLLGLTGVHVNRILREMGERGLIERKGQAIRLLDLPALRRLSPMPVRKPRFEPAWLPKA